MSYNGWTNRETWLVNVWFNPESKADVENAKCMIDESYDALPDYMKDFVSIDQIDWDELADHFPDDEDEEPMDLETFKRSI
jgi:hypothetical protein